MDWRWLFTSFDGRINRAKFWAGSIVLWIIYILAILVMSAIFGMQYVPGQAFPAMEPVAWLVLAIVWLAFAYASFAVWVKRWHDRDKSGWWSLIAFIPLVGAIWIVVELGCLPGTEDPNRFGPDPLAGST